MFFFLIGAALPVIGWLATLKWPNSFMKYVNFPVILSGTGLIPPATAFNYVPCTIVGFVFNYIIRRRHFSWWTKYNCAYRGYCLSSRIDLTCPLHRRPIRCTRLGRGARSCHHLLLLAVPEERQDRREYNPTMVGQHRVHQYSRLAICPTTHCFKPNRHVRVRFFLTQNLLRA